MLNIQYYYLELRSRFYYCLLSILMLFCFIYMFLDDFYYLIILPIIAMNGVIENRNVESVDQSNAFTFICTNISELFQTSIEITIQFSFFIFIPFFLYNIWVFLIPSLYCFERKKWTYDLYIYIYIYILAIFLNCIVVFPFFWKFFMHFQEEMLLRNNSFFFQLQNQPRISSYLSFFFHTEIITHFFCETPFFFYLLLKYNYIQIAQIIKNRRIIYFNLLLFIALISPPEILTQILFFIMTIFLFELLIFFQIINQKFNTVNRSTECFASNQDREN
jgi:sec-independent protein translocase protein TatC